MDKKDCNHPAIREAVLENKGWIHEECCVGHFFGNLEDNNWKPQCWLCPDCGAYVSYEERIAIKIDSIHRDITEELNAIAFPHGREHAAEQIARRQRLDPVIKDSQMSVLKKYQAQEPLDSLERSVLSSMIHGRIGMSEEVQVFFHHLKYTQSDYPVSERFYPNHDLRLFNPDK
jgi:hypothetical protein